MSTITVEGVLQLIDQLTPPEQVKLRQMIEQRRPMQSKAEAKPQPNGAPASHLKPIPVPDSTREMRWLAEHQREYVGQWVALDGDRLIAASFNHEEVAAAADADVAYLPMFTYVDDPDKIYAGF
ncbi:MAG: DUF5678 domain-containing protein [Acidobacteriota bacterium]